MITWWCLALAWAAPEPPPPPADRLVWWSDTHARINGPWVESEHRVAYHHRLYTAQSPWLAANALEVGVRASLAASWARGGAELRVQPVAPLTLYAAAEGVGTFGTFGVLTSYLADDTAFGPSTRQGVGGDVSGGWVLTLGARAQVKLGPVGLSSTTEAVRWDLAVADDTPRFYEPSWDLLVADGGWALQEQVDVVGLFGQPFLGARYTFAQALHPGTESDTLQSTHRLGPLVGWTFHDHPGAVVNRPTVYAVAQWWLSHPYRRGGEVSGLVPLVMVGFSFAGDLLPWRAPDEAIPPPPDARSR